MSKLYKIAQPQIDEPKQVVVVKLEASYKEHIDDYFNKTALNIQECFFCKAEKKTRKFDGSTFETRLEHMVKQHPHHLESIFFGRPVKSKAEVEAQVKKNLAELDINEQTMDNIKKIKESRWKKS